jgi:hypothetical protein
MLTKAVSLNAILSKSKLTRLRGSKFRSGSPNQQLAMVSNPYQQLVNHALRHQASPASLARWLRVLLELSLSYSDAVARQCMDQAVSAAESLRGASPPLATLDLSSQLQPMSCY